MRPCGSLCLPRRHPEELGGGFPSIPEFGVVRGGTLVPRPVGSIQQEGGQQDDDHRRITSVCSNMRTGHAWQ